MAMAIDNILQITDFQRFLGQQVLNVYFYRVLALPDPEIYPNPYDAVLTSFESTVVGPLKNNQHTSLMHETIVVKNLSNGIDIREKILNIAGTATGDEEPSFTALGIRLVRTTGVTRHGSKRIGGMPESYFIGNTLNLSPGQVTAIEFAMGATLIESGTINDLAQPVIVGRTLVPASDPPEYELDLLKINVIADAQIIAVTTQNTRKAGRGN